MNKIAEEEEVPKLNSPAMTAEYKKINCCSWICVVLAIVFSSLAIATPFTIDAFISKAADKSVALT